MEQTRLTTNIVPPTGPLTAKILLIGEAPGKEENIACVPFVGSAGNLLNQCLRSSGIARGNILISNVFCQQPPRNDVSYFFQDKGKKKLTWEGQEHVDRLRSWLEELRRLRDEKGVGPNVIGALGDTAMRILTGQDKISKRRGSTYPCTLVEGFKVYVTYHPSFVMRLMNEPEDRLVGEKKTMQQNVLPLFLMDLERIAIASETREIQIPNREVNICETVQDAVGAIQNLGNAEYVSCDIETLRGEDGPVVWCIGFSDRPSRAFVVPIIKNRKLVWTVEEEARIWIEISKLFLNPNVQKIFHNGAYDLSILGRYYGLRLGRGTYQDTMLGHQCNYPYLKKGLDVCTSIYTWEPYYKDDGKVWDGRRISDYAEFNYNAKDCCVTREILPFIMRDAKEIGTNVNYITTLKVFPSILRMQLRGVKIDVEKKENLAKEFKKRAEIERQKFALTVDKPDVNMDSSSQISKILYGYLDCKIQFHPRTKKPTTDKDAVNKLLKHHPNPDSIEHQALSALSEYRKFSKLVQTYTKMEVDSDGRIHTSYGWVSTFRLSSSESHFGGGGNLQNIPVRTDEGREIRRLFIPDEGRVFLASDLAQAEARVVAWLAGDTRLIEAFNSGWDVHWENAKSIFLLPKELNYNPKEECRDIHTGDEHTLYFYRRLAKTVVHASNYGMGPRMLQTILVREGVYLSEQVCKRLLSSYKTNNPLIIQWQGSVMDEIKASRTLTTPLGDRRFFRGRLNDNLFRSAIAFVPQSTVGRMLQLAIQEIDDELDYMEPLLNVHDEVVVQLKKEDVPRGIKDIRKRMERPLEIKGRTLVIPCDFKTGSTWGDLEEIDE